MCKILTLLWNFPILLSLQVFEDVSNLTQNITKNYKLRDLGNLSKLWPAVSVTNKNDVAVCSMLHPYGGKLRVFFQISYSLIGSTSQMLCLEQSMSPWSLMNLFSSLLLTTSVTSLQCLWMLPTSKYSRNCIFLCGGHVKIPGYVIIAILKRLYA